MASTQKVLKILLIGDGGVGKSSVMNRFITGQFESQSYHTIGVEFLTKDFVVDEKSYTLQIWDTAGQERFKSLRTPFYRGADCCILVYSVDDAQSFHNLTMWQNEFKYYADVSDNSFPFLVIGNKEDIEMGKKEVNKDDVDNWCKNYGYKHIQTSAKSSANINLCFTLAVQKIVNAQLHFGDASISNITSDSPSINLKTMKTSQKQCCS